MTDRHLLAKKLFRIETCVQELRTLARPGEIRHDVREERFVEHTLQIAIQAVIDIANHIVSDNHLGQPETNRELFALLERYGWITADFARLLSDMTSFRNILVHGYDEVDLSIVEKILENHLGDLLLFVETVRARL